MPDCIIRPATTDDMAALARVNLDSWRAAYRGMMPEAGLASLTLAEFETVWAENMAAAGRINLVAELDRGVVGFVSFGPSRDDEADPQGVGEIIGLYVDPAYWGKKLGKALCDKAIASLKAGGFAEVTLWVLRDNARARRFYELAGFAIETGAEMSVRRWDTDLHHVRYRRQA